MDELIESLTLAGKKELINNIKILLYKEDESIFDIIDFEDDNIYQEPLLYAYFNSRARKSIDLKTILYGYIKEESRPNKLKISSDLYGRFYLPNIGWFITDSSNKSMILEKDSSNNFNVYADTEKINFTFEPLDFIKGTDIELLKYPVPLLNQCYFDIHGNLVNVEIEKITQLQRKNLEKAFQIIKERMPFQYKLIMLAVKKAVIFSVDTTLRNSFVTMKALGAVFFNSYQTNYNEVFFLDDIGHQTGHCIFYNILWDTKLFFKIDSSTPLATLAIGNVSETRDLNTLFHAFYTYHVSLFFLNKCLKENLFNGLKRHEVLGRIYFYFGKFYGDILLIDSPIESEKKSKKIFTEDGFKIYLGMKQTLQDLLYKLRNTVKGYDVSNQPYNFTFSKFLELNPLDENNS